MSSSDEHLEPLRLLLAISSASTERPLTLPRLCSPFPAVPGLAAFVESGGEPLKLYGVDIIGNTAIAYIPATEGAQYRVKWLDFREQAPDEEGFEMACQVDGFDVNGTVASRDDEVFHLPLKAPERFTTYAGKQTKDPTKLRPFRFEKLQTTDEDDLASTNEGFRQGVGTIRLTYHRVDQLDCRPPKLPVEAPLAVLGEKDKKILISSQTGFDGPVSVDTGALSEFRSFHRIDRKAHPFSAVEFRYRSPAILQLEGLSAAAPDAPSHPMEVDAQPGKLATGQSGRSKPSLASRSRSPTPSFSTSRTASSALSTYATRSSSSSSPIPFDPAKVLAAFEMHAARIELARLQRERAEFDAVKVEGDEDEPMKEVKPEPEVDEELVRRMKGRGTGKNNEVETIVLE
ncbi:hypothetical protein JCM8097_005505 [Rhodosporidiobolus ruineniae]